MDSTELVQGIRQLLGTGPQPDRDRLTDLATAYIQSCKQVNQRALRCRDLLCRGQRDEAIAEARNAPELRNEIQALAFAERSLWLQLCEQVGIDMRPFDLDADFANRVAADLSADPNTLHALLRGHRFLALSQATLEERLPYLRRIARADPLNTGWQEDVRAFEAARLNELLAELRAQAPRALASGDLLAVEDILKELQSPQWVNPPRKGLLQAIEERTAPLRRAYARKQYAALGEQIREAHSAFDEAKCRDLLQQWHQVMDQTRVQPEPALAELMAPAEIWLKGIDDQKAEELHVQGDCETLQRALDDGKDWREIQRRRDHLLQHDAAAPQELVARAQQGIDAGRRRTAVKRGLCIAGGVAALLTVVAVALALWQAQARRETLKDCESRLDTLISEGEPKGDFGAADQFVVHLKEDRPEVYSAPSIQALLAKLAEKKAAEEDRSKSFQLALTAGTQHLGAARTLADETRPLVPRSHEKEALERVDGNLKQVDGPLAEAKRLLPQASSLMKKEKEKADVSVLRSGIENTEEDVRRIKDDVCRANLEALKVAMAAVEAKYGALENLDLASSQGSKAEAEFSAAAGPCRDLADQIARSAAAGKIAPDARTHLTRLGAMEEEIRKRLGEERARERDLRTICSLYNNPQTLARELGSFRDKHPNHRLAAPFGQAALQVDAWRAVETWQKPADGWRGQHRVKEPATAQSRLNLVSAHLNDYPGSPYTEAAHAYARYLQAAVNALHPEQKLKGLPQIGNTLRDPRIPNLFVAECRDGRRHYTNTETVVRQPGMEGKGGITVKYVVSDEGNMATAYLSEDQLAMPVGTRWPVAPQSAFAKAAFQRFQEFDGTGWETFYLELAADVQRRTDMDAVARATLLKELLGQAAGCLPFKPRPPETFDDLRRSLGTLKVDENWVNPRDERAKAAREQAVALLSEAKPIGDMVKDVEAQVRALAAPLVPYRPVGIFLGAADGGLRLGEAVAQGGLYVLSSEGAALTFHKIGSVPKGQPPVLDPAAAAAVPAGVIVYTRADQ